MHSQMGLLWSTYTVVPRPSDGYTFKVIDTRFHFTQDSIKKAEAAAVIQKKPKKERKLDEINVLDYLGRWRKEPRRFLTLAFGNWDAAESVNWLR